MSAYWPPLENLPTFDVTVFRDAQDVVDFAIATETASKIALTSDDSATTCYIPFSKTTSATSNSLYIDNVTTPLRYRPDTGEVSAQRFSIGGILNPSAGEIASRLFQFTGANPVFEIRNYATSGRIRLVTLDSLNAAINVVTLSTTEFTTITTNNPTITGFTDPVASNSSSNIATTRWVQSAITAGGSATANNIAGGIAGDLLYQSAPSTTAKLPIGLNTYILTSNGSIPVWTAPVVPSTPTLSAVLLAGNSAGSTSINMNSNAITSVSTLDVNSTSTFGNNILLDSIVGGNRQISSSYYNFLGTLAGVGVYCGRIYGDDGVMIFDCPQDVGSSSFVFYAQTNGGPTINVFTISTVDLTITTTNNPTITGFTAPATTDNTAKIATTSWVQSALISGVATATTVAVAVNNTGTTYYPIFASTGAGQKSLLFDTTTTPLSYVPDTSTLTASTFVGALTGNASSATLVNVSATIPAGVYNIPVCSSTGNQQLRSDVILQYDTTAGVNQITANLNGNASSSTLVRVDANDTSTTHYLTFVQGSGAGNKSLRIDPTTTPLSYKPSTGNLLAVFFTVGSVLDPVAGDNAGFLSQNGGASATVVQNQATSGLIHLIVRDSLNALKIAKVSPDDISFTQFSVGNIVNPVAGNNAGFLAQNAGSSATVVQNQATSGLVQLVTLDATNTLRTSLQTSSTDTIIYSRNVRIDNGSGNPITVGNGASTATSNIILASLSLATTRNFTLGGNVIIGSVAGNSLPVAATDNTFVGDSAGASATGSNNICIGFNSQVPTAASSNQIAIGTASETMYIQGGFNWRVGAQITATINLSAVVLAQFYTVAMAAATQTITLPNPTTAAYLGARILFKRKTNTTAFNLAAAGVTPFLGLAVVAPVASPITIGATLFQVELVCDGTNWCIVSTT